MSAHTDRNVVTDDELIRVLRHASDSDILEIIALVRRSAGSLAVLDDMRIKNAAPDLLAALRAFRDGVEDDPVGADHGKCYSFEREGSDNMDIETVDLRCAICRAADDAIAKAEGGH